MTHNGEISRAPSRNSRRLPSGIQASGASPEQFIRSIGQYDESMISTISRCDEHDSPDDRMISKMSMMNAQHDDFDDLNPALLETDGQHLPLRGIS